MELLEKVKSIHPGCILLDKIGYGFVEESLFFRDELAKQTYWVVLVNKCTCIAYLPVTASWLMAHLNAILESQTIFVYWDDYGKIVFWEAFQEKESLELISAKKPKATL